MLIAQHQLQLPLQKPSRGTNNKNKSTNNKIKARTTKLKHEQKSQSTNKQVKAPTKKSKHQQTNTNTNKNHKAPSKVQKSLQKCQSPSRASSEQEIYQKACREHRPNRKSIKKPVGSMVRTRNPAKQPVGSIVRTRNPSKIMSKASSEQEIHQQSCGKGGPNINLIRNNEISCQNTKTLLIIHK